MEKILVSACLLGEHCRYDGKDNGQDYMARLNQYFDLVPFCPEVDGGLLVPRKPAEIIGQGVYTEEHKDVTRAYNKGAENAVRLCKLLGIDMAILKENSPACGVHEVHNGLFNGRLVKGEGFTTRALKAMGVKVMNEMEGLAFLEDYEAKMAEHKKAVEASLNKKEEKEPRQEEKKFHDKPSKREGSKPFHREGKKFHDGQKRDVKGKFNHDKRKLKASVKASKAIHDRHKKEK